MEEDIKRINCLIERCKQCKLNACITCGICWSEVQAIENLINRNKELEEENKKLKTEVETLKRDFEIVDHECSRLEQEDIRKDMIIKEMAEVLSETETDISVIKRQFKEKYCEFINSDEDCCWKTDKKCSDCIKEYFENKVKESM